MAQRTHSKWVKGPYGMETEATAAKRRASIMADRAEAGRQSDLLGAALFEHFGLGELVEVRAKTLELKAALGLSKAGIDDAINTLKERRAEAREGAQA